MNTCQIVVNQNTTPIQVVPKQKSAGRVRAGLRLAQWNRENKGKTNLRYTLKEMLQDFRKDLHDPAAILIAIDETIKILEQNKLEIRIRLKKI